LVRVFRSFPRDWKGAEDDEGVEVFGGAEGVHPKASNDGMAVAEICRKAGISQATYFNWKKKYDGLLPTEMRRLKQLGREQQAAQGGGRSQSRQGDAAGRDPPKTLRPVRKRKLVDEVRGKWSVSIRRTDSIGRCVKDRERVRRNATWATFGIRSRRSDPGGFRDTGTTILISWPTLSGGKPKRKRTCRNTP
jgi:hypothetical protein